MKSRIYHLAILFSFSIGPIQGQYIDQEQKQKIIDRYNQHYGEKVPNLMIFDSTGNQQDLYELNSEIIILNFWATWCAPCMGSIERNKRFYDEMRELGVTDFEWINVSVDQDTAKWKKVIVERNFAGLHAIMKMHDAENDFDIKHYPTYIMLNREKNIIGFELSGAYQGTLLDYFICMGLEGESVAEAYKGQSFYNGEKFIMSEKYLKLREKLHAGGAILE